MIDGNMNTTFSFDLLIYKCAPVIITVDQSKVQLFELHSIVSVLLLPLHPPQTKKIKLLSVVDFFSYLILIIEEKKISNFNTLNVTLDFVFFFFFCLNSYFAGCISSSSIIFFKLNNMHMFIEKLKKFIKF